jgi:DNA-binding Lrp family transcriptional regulator
MQDIDQRDRELLGALQGEIPLVSTPFAFVGQSIDMSEKEVIKRTERLRREGVIRHLAAQFDPRALGYRSCLVAARVAPGRVDEAAASINAHPGVTQNYRRNNDFNLWFTIFCSPESKLGLDRTIELLGREADCDTVRPLPTLKLYKNGGGGHEHEHEHDTHGDYVSLTPLEIEAVRLLQHDLPLQPRPFDAVARVSGITVDELLGAARTLLRRGQIRRFAATVAPRKQGFAATAMGVWVVPPAQHDAFGELAARCPSVSHCYLRPCYPDWPYSIFTMVHGKTRVDCEAALAAISLATRVTEYASLYSTEEFKKVRVQYFKRDIEQWESAHHLAEASAASER